MVLGQEEGSQRTHRHLLTKPEEVEVYRFGVHLSAAEHSERNRDAHVTGDQGRKRQDHAEASPGRGSERLCPVKRTVEVYRGHCDGDDPEREDERHSVELVEIHVEQRESEASMEVVLRHT